MLIDGKRALAYIVSIDEVKTHNSADSLELAHIGGWQIVVRKGEYTAGDLAVMCEVDSWVPQEVAPFLVKRDKARVFEGVPGERLRTVRLRGEVSQGLLLKPDEVFGDGTCSVRGVLGLKVGDDVTDVLGILKWERPEEKSLAGNAAGLFPSYIPKTDQERVENIKRRMKAAYDAGEVFEVTMKLDGSSITVAHHEGQAIVCSRNLSLKLDETNADNAFVATAFKTGLVAALESLALDGISGYAVQGELMGPGIQKNRENLKEFDIYVFDVFDINEQRYLAPTEREQFMCALITKGAKVNHVPVVAVGPLLTRDVFKLVEMADGPSLNNPVREGLVYKSMTRDFSFKTISVKYLEETKQ